MVIKVLVCGKYYLMDNCDYVDIYQKAKWSVQRGYLVQHPQCGGQRFHRLVMNAQPGQSVDHKHGDKADNRRKSLRICTHSQNMHNRRVIAANNSSGFKGVSWNRQGGKWVAQICKDGKNRLIGRFACKIEAARAYNEAALTLHGEFARLNPLP